MVARDGYAGERQKIQPKVAAHEENRTGVSPEHADGENEIPASNTAPGRSPSPSGGGAPTGARGPSGEVSSNRGPSGGRALGIGAAAGLGAAASAGILADGHGQHGGVTGHNSAAHHPTGPLAPPTSSGGDQGFTPVSATASATAPSATGAAPDPAAVAPDPSTPQPADPIQPADGHSSPAEIHPGAISPATGQDPSAAATAGHPVPTGTLSAHDHSLTSTTGQPAAVGTPLEQHGTTGDNTPLDTSVPGQADQPVSDGTTAFAQDPGINGVSLSQSPGTTTTLYDSSGHPVMTADASGQWHPVVDTTGTPNTTGHFTPPVLYDSTGHPVAMTDGAGNVVPISAKTAPHQTATTHTGQISNSSVSPGGQGSAPSQGNGTGRQRTSGEWQQVQLTDDQIPPYLLSQSPEERQQEIINTLAKNHMDLPGGAKEWATLPPEFWNNLKAHYQLTYNDGHGDQNLALNALGAAAVATYLLTEHPALHVEIDHLNDAAKGLNGEADIVSGQAPPLKTAFDGLDSMWSVLFGYAGDSADQTVQQLQANAAQARSYLLGGNTANYDPKYGGKTDGSIANIANALKGAANSLSNAAKGYQNAERANAKQFGLNL